MTARGEALRAALRSEKVAFDRARRGAPRTRALPRAFFAPNARGERDAAAVLHWRAGAASGPLLVPRFTGTAAVEPAVFLPPLVPRTARAVAALESRGFRFVGASPEMLLFRRAPATRAERRAALRATSRRFAAGVLLAFLALEVPYLLYHV